MKQGWSGLVTAPVDSINIVVVPPGPLGWKLRFDQGDDFASDTFTAPVTGKYQFNVNVLTLGLTSSHNTFIIGLVTSNKAYRISFDATIWTNIGHASQFQSNGGTIVDMDAGDTAYVTIRVDGGTKVVDVDGAATGGTSFSGCLLA